MSVCVFVHHFLIRSIAIHFGLSLASTLPNHHQHLIFIHLIRLPFDASNQWNFHCVICIWLRYEFPIEKSLGPLSIQLPFNRSRSMFCRTVGKFPPKIVNFLETLCSKRRETQINQFIDWLSATKSYWQTHQIVVCHIIRYSSMLFSCIYTTGLSRCQCHS